MIKKVGIISFQNANNYGALLQLFALQTAVKKLGKKPEIINYESGVFDFEDKQLPVFKDFKKKYLNMSPRYSKDFTLSGEEYESVITGSDQVWNNTLTGGDANYYLKFCKDEGIRKIAYAVSTGNNSEKEDYLNYFLKEYVRDFYKVSLREQSRMSLIRDCIGRNVDVTLDPTQLLEEKDYLEVLDIPSVHGEGYILLFKIWQYERLKDFTNLLSLYYNKKVVAISDFESEYAFVEGSVNYNFPSVENWLGLIRNAGLVVTDSFHGLMFSIIFRRPFYVWAEEGPRADRIKTILSKIKLENRMLTSNVSLPEVDFGIDYSYAEKALEKEREASLDFLREALF